jgi:hypothetical protein
MSAKRLLLVLVVAFATLAFGALLATAAPGPRWPKPVTTPATKPLPAAVIAPKSAAMLSGSSYPWVQPKWVRVHGVTLPILPLAIVVGTVQPPASIPIGL